MQYNVLYMIIAGFVLTVACDGRTAGFSDIVLSVFIVSEI